MEGVLNMRWMGGCGLGPAAPFLMRGALFGHHVRVVRDPDRLPRGYRGACLGIKLLKRQVTSMGRPAIRRVPAARPFARRAQPSHDVDSGALGSNLRAPEGRGRSSGARRSPFRPYHFYACSRPCFPLQPCEHLVECLAVVYAEFCIDSAAMGTYGSIRDKQLFADLCRCLVLYEQVKHCSLAWRETSMLGS